MSISLLLLFFLPILILGEHSWILIHDNLDSEFIYLHLLKVSSNLFSHGDSAVVSQIFNGLSTKYFHSEFSFIRVLFYLFPSFWAYIVNSFLVRLVGVVGMHLLITTNFKDLIKNKTLTILIPLSFGLLPIYSLYGISVMGQPILLWSFLNLKSNTNIYSSLIIVFLFPFYSHFAMTAPFLLIALFAFGIGNVVSGLHTSPSYFIGIVTLFISYVFANYFTIENFLFSDELSHRSEWHFEADGFKATIKIFIETLVNGQYHSAKLFGLPVLLLGFFVVFRKFKHWKGIGLIILSIIAISLLHSVYKYISIPLEEHLHILTSFQFDRFTFLLPFLFYLLLIKCLISYPRESLIPIIVTVLFFLGNLYMNKEFMLNGTRCLLPNTKTNNLITFSKFYSEDLFDQVNDFIGKPQKEYRVVSLGLHPSISQYNGFYTLDSYQNNYPLRYKRNFKKVIEPELKKDSRIKDYFNNWGNRCYLLSAELRDKCFLNCAQNSEVTINSLSINTEVLQEMGCQYIFSAVKILNAEDLNLNFEKLFRSNQSAFEIYVYRL